MGKHVRLPDIRPGANRDCGADVAATARRLRRATLRLRPEGAARSAPAAEPRIYFIPPVSKTQRNPRLRPPLVGALLPRADESRISAL